MTLLPAPTTKSTSPMFGSEILRHETASTPTAPPDVVGGWRRREVSPPASRLRRSSIPDWDG